MLNFFRFLSLLPLLSSMVCMTLELEARPPCSWQPPTMLFRFKPFPFPSLFSRGWPGVWLFLGSSLHAQRCRQVTLNPFHLFNICQGYGGPVNDFLAWPVFAPLSRLTYCCYLIHMEILGMFGLSVLSYPNDVGHFQIKVVVNQMFQITLLSVVSYFLGGLLISLSAATIFVLAFETPFTRVEKILVRENSQSSCKLINV